MHLLNTGQISIEKKERDLRYIKISPLTDSDTNRSTKLLLPTFTIRHGRMSGEFVK